jgi:hypothetical protein
MIIILVKIIKIILIKDKNYDISAKILMNKLFFKNINFLNKIYKLPVKPIWQHWSQCLKCSPDEASGLEPVVQYSNHTR